MTLARSELAQLGFEAGLARSLVILHANFRGLEASFLFDQPSSRAIISDDDRTQLPGGQHRPMNYETLAIAVF